jgi:hypothetical protein
MSGLLACLAACVDGVGLDELSLTVIFPACFGEGFSNPICRVRIYSNFIQKSIRYCKAGI